MSLWPHPSSTLPTTLTSHLCVSDASHLHLPQYIHTLCSPYFHNRSAAVAKRDCVAWCAEAAVCARCLCSHRYCYSGSVSPSLPPHCSQNTAVAGGNNGPGNDRRSQLCWSRTVMLNPACGRSFLRGNKIIQEALQHTVSHQEIFLVFFMLSFIKT